MIQETPLRGGQHIWTHFISADRRRLVSVGDRGLVRFGGVGKWRFKQFQIDSKRRFGPGALSPDGTTLALASKDNKIVLYRLDNGQLCGQPRLPHSAVGLQYTADGKALICLTNIAPPQTAKPWPGLYHVTI